MNILAANGEQGEVGSAWCSWTCALCVFRGVDLRFAVHVLGGFVDGGGVLVCAVHVLGGFCGREWCFCVCRPRFGRFLWTGHSGAISCP